ncbi:protein Muk1p [Monosporozyma servazzii]
MATIADDNQNNQNMTPFYTPPINTSRFNANQALKESYNNGEPSVSTTPSSNTTSEKSRNIDTTSNTSHDIMEKKQEILSQEEIENISSSISELPEDLMRLVDLFIADLKQPKYIKPLSITQLASLFQAFYIRFDKACYQYLTKITSNHSNSFLSAREALSTGLSGIFSRSRSGSATNTVNRGRNRRSSSLFSSDSISNAMPLLSSEEIDQQLRNNAENNVKIEKYLQLCEKAIFKRLLEVGTSVSSPLKSDATILISNNSSSTDKLKNRKENFNINSLFRNTPKYIEFDECLKEKINCLNELSLDENINLGNFLGVSDSVDINNEELHNKIDASLNKMIFQSISPYEKIAKVLEVHDIMTTGKAVSNDDFLSVLIYHIIKLNPKNVFLNEEFIKLFRYKKKLVENEMFALTNLDAALMFIEGLTLDDFPKELQARLKDEERLLFEGKISDSIELSSSQDNAMIEHTESKIDNTDYLSSATSSSIGESKVPTNSTRVVRSNSHEGIRSVLDGSLKNILFKMKSYTSTYQDSTVQQQPQPQPQPQSLSLSKNNSELFIDFGKHTTASPVKLNPVTSINEASLSSFPVSNASIPEEWCKYKNTPFEDMKVTELREMYDLYQKLIE